MAADEDQHHKKPTAETGASSSSVVSMAEDLQRTVMQSKDSAIRSARSLQLSSSSHLRSFQDFVPHIMSQYRAYEDAFFNKVKVELSDARDHPAAAIGVPLTVGILLMRGPRRFLFRRTLGQLQSEEAKSVRAEKQVKELNISVDLVKKETSKLLERAALAEKDMKYGHTELRNAGSQFRRLAKSVYKVEAQAEDLMDGLREIYGREALTLRAEVASMTSLLKRERILVDKRIMRISDFGVPV